MNYYRSPYAPRMHFDEAGAGAAADAGAAAAAGAGAAKPWFDGIDAETIGHWDNKGWKKDDPKVLTTELTKAWKGLEKHFGTPADQLIKLPKDNADEAGWSSVRERLGMPKEAKDYDFSSIKRADGRDLDAALLDRLRPALHKAGTPKDAAPEVIKAVVGHLDAEAKATADARAARLATDRASLQTEWGQNFEFNRVTAMQGARRAVGSDEGAAKLVESMQEAIGYKATMEFWRKIGSGTSEDTFHDVTKGGGVTTRNGAVARKAELEGDAEWVSRYTKGGSKERQEMDSLMQQIHGVAA